MKSILFYSKLPSLLRKTAIFSQLTQKMTTITSNTVTKSHSLTSPSSRLILDASEVPHLQLSIKPQWLDHCHWQSSSSANLLVHLNNDTTTATTTDDIHLVLSSKEEGRVSFEISTPEMIDVVIVAKHLQLDINEKLMGDFSIICDEGEISVNKLRGSSLSFDVGQANIKVKKALEGGIAIRCQNIWAKMINAAMIDIETTGKCEIEAIYSPSSSIHCHEGNLHVDLLRGYLHGVVDKGNIVMEKIDGGFNVEAKEGDLSVQINALQMTPPSQGKASKELTCLINPEISCSVDCSSTNEEVMIVGDQFNGHASHSSAHGRLIGKESSSAIPLSSQSGKIDLGGAEVASRRTLGLTKENDTSAAHDHDAPHLILQAGARLSMQTLSWIDVIRKKHGYLK